MFLYNVLAPHGLLCGCVCLRCFILVSICTMYDQDGTFIIRDSTKVIGEYSLSLWFGGIRHLRCVVVNYFILSMSCKGIEPIGMC